MKTRMWTLKGKVFSYVIYVDPSPVGWESTYCFTAVGVGMGVTPITRAIPAQIFLGVACFLFPRSLHFDFCYDLDSWAQGYALRVFFIVICFSKRIRGISIKHG